MSRTTRTRIFVLVIALIAPALAVGQSCIAPDEPYPYEPPDDPELRNIVNQQYAQYMEQAQDYLNCLQHEYQRAFNEAKQMSRQWLRYFEADAAITISPNP